MSQKIQGRVKFEGIMDSKEPFLRRASDRNTLFNSNHKLSRIFSHIHRRYIVIIIVPTNSVLLNTDSNFIIKG